MINRFVSFVLDAVLVSLFVLLGMASHSTPMGEYLATAWPFWLGLVIGWFAWVLLKPDMPGNSIRSGLVVWGCTVAFGLMFRIMSGGGVSGAFPYITLGVLALFLLGWRIIYVISQRNAKKTQSAAADADQRQRTKAKQKDRIRDRADNAHTKDRDDDRPERPATGAPASETKEPDFPEATDNRDRTRTGTVREEVVSETPIDRDDHAAIDTEEHHNEFGEDAPLNRNDRDDRPELPDFLKKNK